METMNYLLAGMGLITLVGLCSASATLGAILVCRHFAVNININVTPAEQEDKV